MPTPIHILHRGINAPLEFRGLKAQYILYAFIVVITGIVCFTIAYCSGLTPWICLCATAALTGSGIACCYRLSDKYGPHGRTKRLDARQSPKSIKYSSRQPFLHLIK